MKVYRSVLLGDTINDLPRWHKSAATTRCLTEINVVSLTSTSTMPEDSRKTHVLTLITNYFGFDRGALSSLADHRSLKSFLDDANCPLLSAIRSQKNSVDLSNEVLTHTSSTVARTLVYLFILNGHVGQSGRRLAMSRPLQASPRNDYVRHGAHQYIPIVDG